MGFSAQQKKALDRGLDSRAIRSREFNGRELSYIEGWYAIAEANRIFGFDGWDRETVEARCVLNREIRGNHHAVYVAKVRVTVHADGQAVLREGHGTGEGRGPSPGNAHETALKMAETDATKRALATFGKPFGLALYLSKAVRGRGSERRIPVPARSRASALTGTGSAEVEAAEVGPNPVASSAAIDHPWADDPLEARATGKPVHPVVTFERIASGQDRRGSRTRVHERMGNQNPCQPEQPAGSEVAAHAIVIDEHTDHAVGETDNLAVASITEVMMPPASAATSSVMSPAPSPSTLPLQTAPALVPPGIDKGALQFGFPRRYRDKAHLAFVAAQPCLFCGRQPSDAHHLRFAQSRAMSMKVSDEFTVPLCRTHHRQLHQSGNEPEWWIAMDRDVDPLEVAKGLWEESRQKNRPRPAASTATPTVTATPKSPSN